MFKQHKRVIPILLIKEDGLVKTTKFKDPKYVGDPINAVKIFNDMQVDELVIFDITASLNSRGPNFSLLESLASECFMPLTYGGGITTLEEVKRLFYLGIEKVCFNTSIETNPDLIKLAAKAFGAQSILACIDIEQNIFKKYKAKCKSGTQIILKDLFPYIKYVELLGVGEIVINIINRDGTRIGYDIELLAQISSMVNVPIIAVGGAGQLSHIQELFKNTQVSAAGAGTLFVFTGKHKAVLITYPSPQELKQIRI